MSPLTLNVDVVIGNASLSVSSTSGFVGMGKTMANSQLDVAGGITALSGFPTAPSQNVGYSFSSASTTGMV